jgi:hypothetical protein
MHRASWETVENRKLKLAHLLNRLAAATDLQQLLPPATADLGALADSLGVLWVVLFHLSGARKAIRYSQSTSRCRF